ncbi:MAG: hypothetical protein PVG07_03215 [Acidobacteriota bacterium]|jgi:hypothetical protein
MSSMLFLINWSPDSVTPTLNQGMLTSIKPSSATYEYYPYQITVPRDASGPGEPGEWGNVNSLVVKHSGSSGSQVYNDLADPEGAEPNTDLLLWIFPEFIVFSQRETQLGSPVYPGTASTST